MNTAQGLMKENRIGGLSWLNSVVIFFPSIVPEKESEKKEIQTQNQRQASSKEQFKDQEDLSKALTCLEGKLSPRTISLSHC